MIAGTLEIQMMTNLARLAKDMNDAKSTVDKSMKGIEASVESAKKALAALGITIGAGYFFHLIQGSVEAAAKLEDLHQATNISMEDLAGLSLLARQSGTDLDSLAKAIERMSVAMGKEPERFRQLGVTAKDPLEAFKQMADIFNLLPDIQQRNALAQAVFNRSWMEVAPALALGSQKIGEIIEKGTRLSGVTEEISQQAKMLDDKWKELHGTGGLLMRLVGPALPLLNMLADDILKVNNNSKDLQETWSPLLEVMKVLLILGANISFMFETMGKDIARAAENVRLIAKGDFAGSRALGEMFRKDAERLRAELDAYEKRVMGLKLTGHPTEAGAPGGNDAAASAAASARAKMFLANKDADIYAARVEAIKGGATTLIAQVKTQEELIRLAFQETGINTQRTREELLLAESALADKKLQIQLKEFQELKALAEEKGNQKDAVKNAELIAQANAAIAANEAITQAKIRAERTTTAQAQQAQYNAWATGLENQGLLIAQSFDSQADTENRAYAQKQQALEVYLAANQDQITNAAALRERLEIEHQANLGSASAQGAMQRFQLEKMTLQQQSEFYFGTLQSVTAAAAQHNRTMFEINRAAAVANAIMSTATGMAKALEWGFPLGPIFAAVIGAAGAINIATILSTNFQGGNNVAPSVGAASAGQGTPVFNTNQAPQQQAPQGQSIVLNLTVNGHILDTKDFTNNIMIPALKDAIDNHDVTIIGPNSRQAQNLQPA